MTTVPGWTSVANTEGAFGLTTQVPNQINMETLVQSGGGGGGGGGSGDVINAAAAPYNADYTGSTDASTAINAALLAAGAANVPGTVWLPPGTYLANETIQIGANGVSLRGNGMTYGANGLTTISGGASLTAPLLLVQNYAGTSTFIYDNVISGIRFSGNNPSLTTDTVGMQRISSINPLIEGCTFIHFAKNVAVDCDPAGVLGGSYYGVTRQCYMGISAFNITTSAVAIGTLTATLTSGDVHHELYQQCRLIPVNSGGTTSGSQYGFYAGLSDTHILDDIYIGEGSTAGIAFDYGFTADFAAHSGGFPSEYTLRRPNFNVLGEDNTGANTQFAVNINPSVISSDAFFHRVYDPEFENGRPALTTLDNLIAPWNFPTTSWNSRGQLTISPSFGGSGTAVVNPNLYPCFVTMTANDSTSYVVLGGGGGTAHFPLSQTSSSSFLVGFEGSITPHYSSAPTWEWHFAGGFF